MARQGPAYLSNLSFVKMERPGQGSPRMTEFRSPAVALSIIQTSALISTSENDRGQTDSGNEMRKVKRELDRETKEADRCGISYFCCSSKWQPSFVIRSCPGEDD